MRPGTNASGSYAFDARNRIASRTRRASGLVDVSETFSYDTLGNLVSLGGEPQRFEHPDKPHALTSRSAKTYAYDASGNLARAGGRHFRFDSADRLVCIGSAAGQCNVLHVVYDADGERVAEQAGSTKRGFLGPEQIRTIAPGGVDESRLEITAFGERIAYTVIDARSNAAALFVFDFEVPPWMIALVPGAALLGCLALALRGGLLAGVARRPVSAGVTGLLIAAVAIPSPVFAGGGGASWQPTYRWVLSDALGSGLAVLDETGLLLHQTRFEPFGGVDEGEYHAASDLAPRRYFAGHPEQAETGLHYMNARWLDPETGTFLSVDPVVRDAANPQSLNGYAYAENNPIAFNDPTGACLPVSPCDGKWYGLLPYGAPVPSYAQVANPGYLAEFGVKPGMYAGDIGAVVAGQESSPVLGDLTSGAPVAGVSPVGPASPGGEVFAAIGGAASAAGSAIARVAEIMAWDFALAMVGIVGMVFGMAAGLIMGLQGLALLDVKMVGIGLSSSLWALVPRYGFWSGPYWGQPNLEAFGSWFGPYGEQNVIESATHQHDLDFRNPGADRRLIHDVWSRGDLGPFGQVYRVGLTALFGTRIALGGDD